MVLTFRLTRPLPEAKNHSVPYVGHLRISEVNRETIFNLLVNVLPAEEASQITIRATRKVLSAMCQMAFDEGYRNNNPMRSIRLKQAPAKPVLVASHAQWRRLEEAMTYPPARLYARLNVTTWARRCEIIGFRPRDFDFGQQMLNVTRSTVYVNAKYHPSGKAGWFTKPNPKNGDWRRFAVLRETGFAMWLPRFEAIARGLQRWQRQPLVRSYLEEFAMTRRQFAVSPR